MLEYCLAVTFAASCFMTGLIWFVQIVHYPLMSAVGSEESVGYARRHQMRTTLVVAPVMLAESVSGVLASSILLAGTDVESADGLVHASLALLAVIWLSTFAVQVPRHARLLEAKDDGTVVSLVTTNWIRTIAWTARSCLLGVVVLG